MELCKEWGTKNPEILQNPEIPKFPTSPTQVIPLAPKAALQQQAADFPTQVDFSLQIALERNVPHLACKV